MQVTQEKDYVLMAIATPTMPESRLASQECCPLHCAFSSRLRVHPQVMVSSTLVGSLVKSGGLWTTLEKCVSTLPRSSSPWCVNHPLLWQVTSMLPGGIFVVGVFLSCSAEHLSELQPWLARLLPLLCPLSPSLPHSSRLLVHTAGSDTR